MNGITAGTLYTFTITATNGRGESQPSSPVSIYAAMISNAPQNLLRSSTTTKNSITFTWSVPAYDGGSPVFDYAVYWD
jgi:outer membrane protein TolC